MRMFILVGSLGLCLTVGALAAPAAMAQPLPYGPDTCIQGYVWREARPSDHVCVTPASRSRARADNAAAASRVNPGGGAYGPNTCRQGYVWREAFPGDFVCVTPPVRTETRAENAAANSRFARNASPAAPPALPYGPDTCLQGYVWREARASDHVCVPPPARDRVRVENAQAASHRQPLVIVPGLVEIPGGGPCYAGYIERWAFDQDRICVTHAARALAQEENALGPSRRAGP